jgi:hypothetical protein
MLISNVVTSTVAMAIAVFAETLDDKHSALLTPERRSYTFLNITQFL